MKKFFDGVRWALFITVLLAAGSVLQAQEFLGISGFYEPLPERKIEAEGVFPILLNEDPDTHEPRTVFINRFTYINSVYDFDEWGFRAGGTEQTEMFHRIIYNLVYVQKLTERWSLISMVEPSLSSDFRSEISIEDFYLTAQAGFTVQVLDNLVLGATVGYTTGFPFPYPILVIQWGITDWLEFIGYLPKFAALQFKVSPYLDFGINAEMEFLSQHGDPDRYGVDNPQLTYNTMRAGPYIQVNLGEVEMGEQTHTVVHFMVEGGYYYFRNFSFADGSEVRESINLDGAFFVRGGLILGI